MSFFSLPTELVRQIIESSVPSTFHSTTYQIRKSTLRSLCLVSRRFRSIAQPLLFQTIFVRSPEKLAIALYKARSEGWDMGIQELVVEDGYICWPATSAAEVLSLHAKNLRSLVLYFGHPQSHFDAYGKHLGSNLETLRLHDRGFDSPIPFAFSNLVSFTIDDRALKKASRLFDPTYLPSLRHLALPDVDAEMDLQTLRMSRLAALLPQLDTISLTAALYEILPDYLFPFIYRTLFDFNARGGLARPGLMIEVTHLRIINFNDTTFAFEVIGTIPELVTSIRDQDPIRLRSIYLDPSLRDPSSLSEELSDLAVDLLEVCQEKAVEVIYEIQPEATIDPCISNEFCKRSRMRKEAESKGEQS